MKKALSVTTVMILSTIMSNLYGQDYYIYSLFNDKFQAVFQKQPRVMTVGPITMYIDGDLVNQIAFNAQSMPSGLQDDIKVYNKKSIDDLQKDGLKLNNLKLVSFSSKMNRKDNMYTYLATVKVNHEGVIKYKSAKYIIYGKTAYKWTVIYQNLNNKHIFDQYKELCKIIQ